MTISLILGEGIIKVNYEHKLYENVELEIAKYKVETHCSFN